MYSLVLVADNHMKFLAKYQPFKKHFNQGGEPALKEASYEGDSTMICAPQTFNCWLWAVSFPSNCTATISFLFVYYPVKLILTDVITFHMSGKGDLTVQWLFQVFLLCLVVLLLVCSRSLGEGTEAKTSITHDAWTLQETKINKLAPQWGQRQLCLVLLPLLT